MILNSLRQSNIKLFTNFSTYFLNPFLLVGMVSGSRDTLRNWSLTGNLIKWSDKNGIVIIGIR